MAIPAGADQIVVPVDLMKEAMVADHQVRNLYMKNCSSNSK